MNKALDDLAEGGRVTVKKWIFQILIGIDQLANALAGGYADETLSSRAHRMREKGQPYWRWTAGLIDALFFWQKGHCEAAWHSEMKRLQLPPHMRDSTSYTARSA